MNSTLVYKSLIKVLDQYPDQEVEQPFEHNFNLKKMIKKTVTLFF